MGPPENVLGAAVALRLLLARTPNVAVAITDAVVYPAGFELTLAVRTRNVAGPLHDVDFHLPRARRRRDDAEIPPEFLRFGIQFSDGAKATNFGRGALGAPGDAPPSRPLLWQRGGRGGARSWEWRYWVWPLPPPGPLAFVCEWPAEGIPLTRKEIDAAAILEAAEQVETLWEDEGDEGDWTEVGYAETHVSFAALEDDGGGQPP